MSESQPTVCAIMLTADRPEYARKAVENFRAQTYPGKRLYIFDSGSVPCVESLPDGYPEMLITYHNSHTRRPPHRTIGELRNDALEWISRDGADILIHWDDDDYSHPNRIAEQVALLQSSGADAVGYREMLFWRHHCDTKLLTDSDANTISRRSQAIKPSMVAGKSSPAMSVGPPRARSSSCHALCASDTFDVYVARAAASLAWRAALVPPEEHTPGEAWLYSNPNQSYILGTSLCYWRETWERKPFNPTSVGEDLQFCTGLKTVGAPSFVTHPTAGKIIEPRMIARIHAGNSSGAYTPEGMKRAKEWKRVPGWDAYCRSVMEK